MYSQTGNYVALGGLVASLLARIGLDATAEDIALIFSSIAVLIGIIKQYVEHRKLGIAIGAVKIK